MNFCDRLKEGRLPGEKVGGIGMDPWGVRGESKQSLGASWGSLRAVLGPLGVFLGKS